MPYSKYFHDSIAGRHCDWLVTSGWLMTNARATERSLMLGDCEDCNAVLLNQILQIRVYTTTDYKRVSKQS
jgi:hypothetical protein